MFVPLSTLRRSVDWPRWGALAANAPPFLAPEFFALIAPLADAPGAAMVAAAHDDAGLAGALPLRLDGTTLHALRAPGAPRFDYCGNPAGLAEIWRALQRDPRWDELRLPQVPRGSLLATLLPEFARVDGAHVFVRPHGARPGFALERFERRLAPAFLTGLRCAAARAGALVLERVCHPTPEDLDEAAALVSLARGDADAPDTAAGVDHAHRALLRLFGRRGRAALYFLRARGVRQAALIAVEDAQTLYALALGFDPRAPIAGHLLTWMVATEAAERGLARFDLGDLGGAGPDGEAWRGAWPAEPLPLVDVSVYRPSARGLVRLALREPLAARAPTLLDGGWRSPLPRGCQRADVLGVHALRARVADAAVDLARAARWTAAGPPSPGRGGDAARTIAVAGAHARIRRADTIARGLDLRGRRDGLTFMPEMAAHAGRRVEVTALVDRVLEHGRWTAPRRPVYVLADLACTGAVAGGCARGCPLWWHEDWLVLDDAPPRRAPRVSPP